MSQPLTEAHEKKYNWKLQDKSGRGKREWRGWVRVEFRVQIETGGVSKRGDCERVDQS